MNMKAQKPLKAIKNIGNVHLDPMYLNEQMVLSCAGFLFEGVIESTEVSSNKARITQGKGAVGLPKFIAPLSVEGALERSLSSDSKALYKYTLGGIHTQVFNELKQRELLVELTDMPADFAYHDGRYLCLRGLLQPIDFFVLLAALRASMPVITSLLLKFGDQLLHKLTKEKASSMHLDVLKRVTSSVQEVVEQLEADYLKSNHLEMLFAPGPGKPPIAVIDLDLAGHNIDSVRAKLTDGYFVVVGKLTRVVVEGESLHLLQRSSLFALLEIFNKLMALSLDTEGAKQYFEGIDGLIQISKSFMTFTVPGPAIRVVAMSISV